MHNSN